MLPKALAVIVVGCDLAFTATVIRPRRVTVDGDGTTITRPLPERRPNRRLAIASRLAITSSSNDGAIQRRLVVVAPHAKHW